MPEHLPRKFAVLAAVVFAIAAPIWQAMGDAGLSAKDFAAQGDQTLKAAGFAFGIWSLIYVGFGAFAVNQLSRTQDRSQALAMAGWPGASAIFGCGAWIVASVLDLRWLSVAIILASASVLIAGLLRIEREGLSQRERLFVAWPLQLLAGWLTAASGLNIVTVLTAERIITPSPLWAGLTLVAVFAVAVAVGLALRAPLYLAPVAWGLVGVAAAEQARSPVIAAAAAAGALALIILAVFVARGPRTPVRLAA